MSAYLAYLTIVTFCIASTLQSQIRFAFEIFRHGARSPYNELTEDYVDWFGKKWSGVKELTGVGLRQHYLLGRIYNEKYIKEGKLLSEAFDPREIYIISTDSNRTILSANAQLQGLYPSGTGPSLSQEQQKNAVPPGNSSYWEKEQQELGDAALPNKINILPVHNFFTKDHYIQLQDKKVCPHVKDIYEKKEKHKNFTDYFNNMTKNYKETFQKLIGFCNFTNYTWSYSVLDAIIAEYTENVLDVEAFKNAGVNNITKLIDDAFEFFYKDFVGSEEGGEGDLEIGKYSMSPIFRQILLWMKSKVEKDKNKERDYKGYDIPKFVMYSAHDSTVGAFEAFIKAAFGFKVKYAYFASNANLELILVNEVESPTEKDYNVTYRFDDEQIFSISYQEFVKKVTKILKTDKEIEKFCQFKKEEFSYWILGTIFFGIVVIILIGLNIHVFLNKRAKREITDNLDPILQGNENENETVTK